MRRFVLRRFPYSLILLSIAVGILFLRPVLAQGPYTLIVNSEADNDLATLSGNGLCDLREAIETANTGAVVTTNDCGFVPNGAVDQRLQEYVIRFDTTAGATANQLTIPLQTALPVITSQVDIGGYPNGAPSATALVFIEPAGAVGSIGIGFDFGIDGIYDANDSIVTGLIVRNFGVGIRVDGVRDVQIGSGNAPTDALRNYIYNNEFGITIQGATAIDNIVANNSVGITETTAIIGNGTHGIFIQDNASGNIIGGATAAEGNVIGDSGQVGIRVSSASTVTIQNNLIGIPTLGSVTDAGNSGNGISVVNSTSVEILSNVIGNNGANGISLNNSPDTLISDNDIGNLPNTTTSIANTGNGILIRDSSNTEISDSSVANNIGDGIAISTSTGVTITSTVIFENGGLGVDLDENGETVNDGVADADGGANNRQNFVEFFSAGLDIVTDDLTLNATLPTSAGTYQTIYYVHPAGTCSDGGVGQGPDFLDDGGGAVTRTAGAGAYVETITGVTNVSVGDFITALTINQATGDTSEFSRCILVEDATLVADFTPLTGTFLTGTTINFTNLSTGSIASVEWEVDGNPEATTFDFTRSFPIAGTYDITLTITNPSGATDTITGTIIIVVPTPVPPSPVPPSPNPVTPVPPTITPIPSVTDIPTNTPLPTATNLPTLTPLPTLTFTAIPTFTDVPTLTPLPTLTFTPFPTITDVPTLTVTPLSTLTDIPTVTAIPTITGTPALVVTVVGDGDTEMTVFISNVGENAATNLTLEEILRGGVEFRASFPGVPICTEDGGIVTCRLGTLEGGDDTNVNITVQTNGEAPDSGQTIVSADGVQPVIIDEPYIFKIGNPPVAPPGSDIIYTIRVVNPTDESALDMVIQDQMPDIIEINSVESSTGTVEVDGQDIRLALDELAAGERVTMTINATVREDIEASEIINTACVTSSSNPNPNCAIMSFLAVDSLGNTGQTPLMIVILRWVGGLTAIAIATLGGMTLMRSRRKA